MQGNSRYYEQKRVNLPDQDLRDCQQQLDMLNLLLSAATDYLYVIDKQGKYRYANENGAAVHGLTPQDFEGKTWQELGLPAEHIAPFEADCRKVLATGQPVTGEMVFPIATGMRWFEYSLTPIFDEHHEVNAIVFAAKDITEQKVLNEQFAAAYRELERANAELLSQRDELMTLNAALEEANQVRSQFLSTMSHELRTPLSSVIGFSQLLLGDANKASYSDRQKSNLERILKNGKHLLGLINDVLDLTKMEAGRMNIDYKQVDLRELLSSLIEEIQAIAIERKLALSFNVDEELSCIETDAMKLRQVLLNLISNALKFTLQGEVIVSATRAFSSNGGDYVTIAVKDTGIGIAPEEQERIFEAFYQVDGSSTRKFSGTGLGLAIVRQLTELIGGTLAVTSSPGEGSTFTITLPAKMPERQIGSDYPRLHTSSGMPRSWFASSERQALDKPREGSRKASNGQQTIILAIDDDEDVLALLEGTLEHSPYKIVGVRSSLKAIELARELHPSAITLDVMMPNLNGWQILHELKADPVTASIPVIMLTILTERTTGYVLGADDYLIKPFKKDALLDTLDRLVSSTH